MTVGPNGGCYSLLSDISISTGCAFEYPPPSYDAPSTSTTFPLSGTITTGTLAPVVTSWPDPTIEVTTFEESERESLIAVSMRGPIYIVHMPSDLSEGDGASETGDSGGEETGTNAAVSVRPGLVARSWGQIGGVAGVLGVSVLAGMALVLPW